MPNLVSIPTKGHLLWLDFDRVEVVAFNPTLDGLSLLLVFAGDTVTLKDPEAVHVALMALGLEAEAGDIRRNYNL